MASRIEHRAEFAAAAAAVLAAQSEKDALTARLAELGGTDAALLEHTLDGDGVRFRLRQGIAADKLPSVVRSLHQGDLIVEREETWQHTDSGGAGTAKATVAGVPGEIAARTTLTETDGTTVQHTTGEAKVRIPLIGGKLEQVIAEQVSKLLAREAEFTANWLAGR